MKRCIVHFLLAILSLAACTGKITDDINDPNETATVVMVYSHPGLTDSVFFGITGSNVVIDWGDGTMDSIPSLSIIDGQLEQNAPHKYTAEKEYTVKITADDLTLLSAHYLSRINLTRATKLKKLHIPGGSLKELSLKTNVLLEDLWCDAAGNLGALDLSANPLLKTVSVGTCGLRSINISKCHNLTELTCDNNKLSDLNLEGNPALQTVACYYNQLSSIDVSKNNQLKHVTAGNNKFTSIDLSMCPYMTQINLDDNLIAHLAMTTSPDLHSLTIGNNKLSSIDISANLTLRTLSLKNNNINDLNVSNNHDLVNIDLSSNQFSATSLNKVFTDLTPGKWSFEWIRVAANPGANSCDTTIATAKKWKVRML